MNETKSVNNLRVLRRTSTWYFLGTCIKTENNERSRRLRSLKPSLGQKFSVNEQCKFAGYERTRLVMRLQQDTNTSVSDFTSYLACATIYPLL